MWLKVDVLNDLFNKLDFLTTFFKMTSVCTFFAVKLILFLHLGHQDFAQILNRCTLHDINQLANVYYKSLIEEYKQDIYHTYSYNYSFRYKYLPYAHYRRF